MQSTNDRQATYPVLVLWARVVQVLCSDDQRGQKHAVSRTRHSLGYLGQLVPEAFEVDHGGHQCRNLNVGLFADDGDKGFKRGKTGCGEFCRDILRARRWCRKTGGRSHRNDSRRRDDSRSLVGDIVDEFGRDIGPDEFQQCRIVDSTLGEGSRVDAFFETRGNRRSRGGGCHRHFG